MGFLAQVGNVFYYLPELLDSGDLDGMILSASHGAPRGTGAFRQRGGQILIDPQTFRLAETVDTTKRFRELSYVHGWADFDTIKQPGELRTFTHQVLNEELEAGGTEIIAPYFYVDDVRGEKLDVSLRAAEAAMEIAPSVGNPVVWAGIFVSGGEIKRPASRDALLNKVTRSRATHCYLIVDPESAVAGPINDTGLIAGLRYVIQSLEAPANDVRVLLGYSDSLALGLMADGLTAFSSGVHNTLRKLVLSGLRKRRGGGGHPRAKRYYVPSLMNFVRVDRELAAMGKRGSFAGQAPCRCRYCSSNFSGASAYNEGFGWQHYLSTLRRQSAAMAALPLADRLVHFQQQVADAKRTYDSLQQVGIRFDSDSGSGHLRAWTDCFR